MSLYLPFVLLCALLMSACTSEEDQAQQAQQAQERLELDQKLEAAFASEEIKQSVISSAGAFAGVRVVCPDTVDKIVRLGCEATAGDPVKRLRIKVARTGEGDRTEEYREEYRVVTKFLDKRRFEEILIDSLETSVPTRQLVAMDCPALVEKKKGVRFVCKGYGFVDVGGYTRPYTVRVRAGFSDDGGHATVFRIQHGPALSP